jgi:CDP-diacylglycerol---glycerol-3-phosphate 3-phosphatidyltransferase
VATDRAEGLAPRLTTLPNLLGLGRIAATPVIIALLLRPFEGAGAIAAVVFALAAISDVVDGRLARARGQVNRLGVFMDLTADKVLVAGVLIALVEVNLLPTWIVALLIIRELVVQGVRQVAATEDVVMPARALGKGKTIATLAGMELLLLTFDAFSGGPTASVGMDVVVWFYDVGYWTLLLAAALSVASGLEYVRAALPVLRGRAQPPPAAT